VVLNGKFSRGDGIRRFPKAGQDGLNNLFAAGTKSVCLWEFGDFQFAGVIVRAERGARGGDRVPNIGGGQGKVLFYRNEISRREQLGQKDFQKQTTDGKPGRRGKNVPEKGWQKAHHEHKNTTIPGFFFRPQQNWCGQGIFDMEKKTGTRSGIFRGEFQWERPYFMEKKKGRCSFPEKQETALEWSMGKMEFSTVYLIFWWAGNVPKIGLVSCAAQFESKFAFHTRGFTNAKGGRVGDLFGGKWEKKINQSLQPAISYVRFGLRKGPPRQNRFGNLLSPFSLFLRRKMTEEKSKNFWPGFFPNFLPKRKGFSKFAFQKGGPDTHRSREKLTSWAGKNAAGLGIKGVPKGDDVNSGKKTGRGMAKRGRRG